MDVAFCSFSLKQIRPTCKICGLLRLFNRKTRFARTLILLRPKWLQQRRTAFTEHNLRSKSHFETKQNETSGVNFIAGLESGKFVD